MSDDIEKARQAAIAKSRVAIDGSANKNPVPPSPVEDVPLEEAPIVDKSVLDQVEDLYSGEEVSVPPTADSEEEDAEEYPIGSKGDVDMSEPTEDLVILDEQDPSDEQDPIGEKDDYGVHSEETKDGYDSEEEIDVTVTEELDNSTDEEKEEIRRIKKTRHVSVKVGGADERQSHKRFKSYKPSSNLKIVDDPEMQEKFIAQNITGTDPVAKFTSGKTVARVTLPYSGIYIDMSSMTNSEMLSIYTSTNDVDFLDKIETELTSAYEHTTNTSLKKALKYEEWLDSIAYPDIWGVYYATYNANHPGKNTYDTYCDVCNAPIVEKRYNDDICMVSHSSTGEISQDIINRILRGASRDTIESNVYASTIFEKEEVLPVRSTKVSYGMPTMKEVISYLHYLRDEKNYNDTIIRYVLYPVATMYHEGVPEGIRTQVFNLKYTMFVRKLVGIVFNEVDKGDGSKAITATGVNINPAIIPFAIDEMDPEDHIALVSDPIVKELMLKDSIIFRMRGYSCKNPNCKAEQKDLAIDPRNSLFMAAESLGKQVSRIIT